MFKSLVRIGPSSWVDPDDVRSVGIVERGGKYAAVVRFKGLGNGDTVWPYELRPTKPSAHADQLKVVSYLAGVRYQDDGPQDAV